MKRLKIRCPYCGVTVAFFSIAGTPSLRLRCRHCFGAFTFFPATYRVSVKQKRDYYEVLGLAPDAGLREIRKNYHVLIARFHPDKNQDAGRDTTAHAQLINEAYAVLGDPAKKARYDETLRNDRYARAVSDDAGRETTHHAAENEEQHAAEPPHAAPRAAGRLALGLASLAIAAAVVFGPRVYERVAGMVSAERQLPPTEYAGHPVPAVTKRPEPSETVDADTAALDSAVSGIAAVMTRLDGYLRANRSLDGNGSGAALDRARLSAAEMIGMENNILACIKAYLGPRDMAAVIDGLDSGGISADRRFYVSRRIDYMIGCLFTARLLHASALINQENDVPEPVLDRLRLFSRGCYLEWTKRNGRFNQYRNLLGLVYRYRDLQTLTRQMRLLWQSIEYNRFGIEQYKLTLKKTPAAAYHRKTAELNRLLFKIQTQEQRYNRMAVKYNYLARQINIAGLNRAFDQCLDDTYFTANFEQ